MISKIKIKKKGNQIFNQSTILEFRSRYKTFNKEYIMDKLKKYSENNPNFFVVIPKEFRYIFRKHHIIDYDFLSLYTFLANQKENLFVKIAISQALKYTITKNINTKITLKDIFKIFQQNKHKLVKSQMAYILGHLINQSEQPIESQMIQKLIILIEELQDQSKNYLMSEIYKHQQKNSKSIVNFGKIKIQHNNNYRGPEKIMTKNQQKCKISYKSTSTEQTQIKIQNFADALKKKYIYSVNSINNNQFNQPDSSNPNGDDRNWTNGTYVEVRNLYLIALQKNQLKADDKNDYLPKKFLGQKNKYFSKNLARSLFIDRMIGSIFARISKKQELSKNAIDKLMQCVDSFDIVKKLIFDNKNNEQIIQQLACDQIAKKQFENQPQFIKNMANQLYRCLSNVQIINFTGANFDYDLIKVMRFVMQQIQRLRLDVITAIFNCIQNKKLVLSQKEKNKILNLLEDKNHDFKKYLLQILSISGKSELNSKIFENYLLQLQSEHNIPDAINYIASKLRDTLDSLNLFNQNVILKLIKLIKKDSFEHKYKLLLSQIINNYLLDSHEGLSTNCFQNIVDTILKTDYNDLKQQLSKSILLTVQNKPLQLSPINFEKLIKNFKKLSPPQKEHDPTGNFLIIAFSKFCEKNIINNISEISHKLLDDTMIINDQRGINFEQWSQTNKTNLSISYQVARIFYQILKKDFQITNSVAQNLIKVIRKIKDKNAKIQAAKVLYIGMKKNKIQVKRQILIQLSDYFNYKVYDISVLSKVAFIYGLKKFKQIDEYLIETLHEIYIYDNLKLEQEDFTNQINDNILQILLKKSDNEFKQETFDIFVHILIFDEQKQQLVVKILSNYTKHKFKLQSRVVQALENVLSHQQIYDLVLDTLQNIIRNGQAVSDRTLKLFADNLYLQHNESLRRKSYEILEIADNNQQIASQQIFDILEMERAGYSILNDMQDKEYAIENLLQKTKNGHRLSINVFSSLQEQVKEEEVLKILIYVTKNNQMIPEKLLQLLVNQFNPKKIQKQLIKIFFGIVKNNQTVTKLLQKKLKNGLQNIAMVEEILNIFIYLMQKGESISNLVISKMQDTYLQTNNMELKENLMIAFCSYLQLNKLQDLYTFQSIIAKGLSESNINIIRNCVNALKIFIIKKNLINDQILDKLQLILKYKNLDVPKDLKSEIQNILNQTGRLNKDQKHYFKSIRFKNMSSAEEIIMQLQKSQINLQQQQFNRIGNLITESNHLIYRVLNILKNCVNIQNVTDNLLNNLTILLNNTKNQQIKNSSYQIVKNIVKSKRQINEELISVLMKENHKNIINDILKQIGKNYDSKQVKLHFRIVNITKETSIIEFKKILSEILTQFQQQKILSTKDICKILIQFKNQERYKIDKQIVKLIQQICKFIFQQQKNFQEDIFKNKIIIQYIEDQIIQNQINIDIVNSYEKIIRKKQCINIKQSINCLVDYVYKSNINNKKLFLDIFYCISAVFECYNEGNTTIQQLYKGVILLENNLNSESEQIRYECLKILKIAKPQSLRLQIFYESFLQELEKNVNFQEIKSKLKQNYIDLLTFLVSLKYIDYKKIKNVDNVNQWKRDLLLSDLIATMKLSLDQGMNIYYNWILLQKSIDQKYIQKLIALIGLIKSRNFIYKQLQQILRLLSGVDLDSCFYILRFSNYVILDLKMQYIHKLLQKIILPQYKNQIKSLTKKLTKYFNVVIIQKLIKIIKVIDNINLFNQLIQFAYKYNLYQSDLSHQYNKLPLTLSQLRHFFQIKFLTKIFNTINPSELRKIDRLLNNNTWKFEQLYILCKHVQTQILLQRQAKQRNLMNILVMIDQYQIATNQFHKIDEILKNKQQQKKWIQQINKIYIKTKLKVGPTPKNMKNLLEELKELNLMNAFLLNFSDQDCIELVNNIKNGLNKSKFVDKKICQFQPNDITVWVQKIKSADKLINFQNQLLPVIFRANYLFTSFDLKQTQILACLILLNSNQNKGRLLQVGTGEGKSTIVSIIAIYHALNGKKVDIVTSSPILAQRDAKQKSGLYKMFGLTCSFNSDKLLYKKGPKDCYKKNIVYGEASQFQFDKLRDIYNGLETLANRKCELVIVDEVDSLLIDESSKIARLAANIAGLDQLQPIYHFLWQHLIQLQNKIIEINGKMYFIQGKISYQEKISVQVIDANNNIQIIPDLKQYLTNNPDINKIGQCIQQNLERFIKLSLKNSLDNLISNKTIKISVNFIEYVKKQIPKWIDNAILALNYQQKIHYVVHDGLIKAVDYNSTGIIQNSTNWSDGLHQFLQIKHNLKMTSQTFTTNFLSNISYFKEYGSNLYGMTGTLGSKTARQVLMKVYNVDIINIPRYYQEQYLNLDIKKANSDCEWLKLISTSAIIETQKKRGVLIICETIQHAEIIFDNLKFDYKRPNIKVYTMNNMNQQRQIGKISPRQIIIATNLAGRGTDIKTDQIEQYGGMHVIVTYMPTNQRVEDQALGRTARQGKRGTGQIILNKNNFIGYDSAQDPKKMRDQMEKNYLQNFMKKELLIIQVKDNLFKKFCNLLKLKREQIKKNKNNLNTKIINSATYERNVLAAIEEQWAIFLLQIEDQKIQKISNQYKNFQNNIKNQQLINLIKNPYYHIVIANDLVMVKNEQGARYHYQKALQLDRQNSAAAYVGLAWIWLKQKQKCDYKYKAIDEFQKALPILNGEVSLLCVLSTLLKKRGGAINNPLGKQLIQKINILKNYINSIQNNIAIIKKSLRFIDVIYQYQDLNMKQINYIHDLARNKLPQDAKTYELIFHHLTQRIDIGNDSDQAVNIIKEYKKIIPNIQNKKYISLMIKCTNVMNLNKFLNKNIEINNLDKESAILQLKNRSSRLDKLLSKDCKIKLFNINHNRQYNQLLIQKAIQIIKSANQNDHFNLTFINQNPQLIQLIRKYQIQLNIEFKNLTKKDLGDKQNQQIFKFKYKMINIEVSTTSQILLNLIKCISSQYLKLCTKNLTEMLSIQTAVNKIRNLTKTEKIIAKFENIKDEEELKNIIHKFSQLSFNIQLIDININDQQGLNNLLRAQNIQDNIILRFYQLSVKNACEFIPFFRKQNFEFSLSFHHLNFQQVKSIVQKSEKYHKQQDITISRIKSLAQIFVNDRPESELSQFNARGIQYLLEVNEKKFRSWNTIITISILGAIQIAAGAALLSTGVGANFGIALISEGVSDLILSATSICIRQFKLSNYLLLKAVSVPLSILTFGFSSLQAISPIIKKIILVTYTSTKNVIGGISLMSGLDSTNNQFGLQILKQKIQNFIYLKIYNKLQDSKLQNLIKKIYTLDKINNSNNFQKQKIAKIIAAITNQPNLLKQYNSLAKLIIKKILADPNSIANPLYIRIRIIAILNHLQQISIIINETHKKLIKKLSQIDKQNMSMALLLNKNCQIDSQISREIVDILYQKKIIILVAKRDHYEYIHPEVMNNNNVTLDYLNLGNHNIFKNNIINFLRNFHNQNSKLTLDDLNQTIKQISRSITQKIMNIIESQLISSEGIDNILSSPLFQSMQRNQHLNVQQPINRQIIHENHEKRYDNQQIQDYVQNIRQGESAQLIQMMILAEINDINLKIIDNRQYRYTKQDIQQCRRVVVYIHAEKAEKKYQLLNKKGKYIEIDSNLNNSGYAMIGYILKEKQIDKKFDQLRQDVIQYIQNNLEYCKKIIKNQNWILNRRVLQTSILISSYEKQTYKQITSVDTIRILYKVGNITGKFIYFEKRLKNFIIDTGPKIIQFMNQHRKPSIKIINKISNNSEKIKGSIKYSLSSDNNKQIKQKLKKYTSQDAINKILQRGLNFYIQN